ncbi:MAG: YIP1 family protein [Myxococcales bacterium]
MIAKCARCQYVFTTDRYGRQFCPSCGAELVLPAPSGATPPAGPPSQPSGAGPVPGAGPLPGPGVGPVRGPSAPPPAQPFGTAVPPQAPAPGGQPARCPSHPDRPATDVCARCGSFTCRECLQPGVDGQPQCPACRGRGGEVQPTPWEERGQRGVIGAYLETVKLSVTDPVRLFERMRVDNAAGALSYFWINFAVGVIAAQAWAPVISGLGFDPFKQGGAPKLPEGFEKFVELNNSFAFNLAAGVVLALLGPVFLYLVTGVIHLGLLLFQNAPRGFNATLRSVSYASAPQLLQLVPICLGPVGGVWSLVLIVIGLSRTHRISVGKALLGVAVPLVVVFCCCCGLFSMALAGTIAAAGTMPH